jgi:hypothetical protein
MNAQTIAAAFAVALGVLGLGTAVVIGLQGRAFKADLTRVRESNDDLRHANDDLRAELSDKDRHMLEQDVRIHDLERDYAELKAADERKGAALARIGEQAASGAELRELVKIVRDHDKEAAVRHGATIKVLREIRDAQASRRDKEGP